MATDLAKIKDNFIRLSFLESCSDVNQVDVT